MKSSNKFHRKIKYVFRTLPQDNSKLRAETRHFFINFTVSSNSIISIADIIMCIEKANRVILDENSTSNRSPAPPRAENYKIMSKTKSAISN